MLICLKECVGNSLIGSLASKGNFKHTIKMIDTFNQIWIAGLLILLI